MKQDDSLPLNAAQEWLKKFESALAKSAAGEIEALFCADCHWREVRADLVLVQATQTKLVQVVCTRW